MLLAEKSPLLLIMKPVSAPISPHKEAAINVINNTLIISTVTSFFGICSSSIRAKCSSVKASKVSQEVNWDYLRARVRFSSETNFGNPVIRQVIEGMTKIATLKK